MTKVIRIENTLRQKSRKRSEKVNKCQKNSFIYKLWEFFKFYYGRSVSRILKENKCVHKVGKRSLGVNSYVKECNKNGQIRWALLRQRNMKIKLNKMSTACLKQENKWGAIFQKIAVDEEKFIFMLTLFDLKNYRFTTLICKRKIMVHLAKVLECCIIYLDTPKIRHQFGLSSHM